MVSPERTNLTTASSSALSSALAASVTMNTTDYLISETDRRVTSILDTLEVVSVKYRNPDCNHIFMNCIYNLSVSYVDVLAAVSGFIERHGKHLW